jgi:hypothetical protein
MTAQQTQIRFSNQDEAKLKDMMNTLSQMLDENDIMKLSSETLEAAQSLTSELIVKILLSIPTKKERKTSFRELLGDLKELGYYLGLCSIKGKCWK